MVYSKLFTNVLEKEFYNSEIDNDIHIMIGYTISIIIKSYLIVNVFLRTE
ncbi:hypothetical protein C1646_777236 [Rhizophagus diaphanus]|nr:hypothetical protein C1646_777236 [Rhizophagus diaphanus] [Rhizophagus sp. MUCL 43196]